MERDILIKDFLTTQTIDLYSLENLLILAVMDKHKSNKTHAARELKIAIRTLRNRLKRLYVAEEKT